MENKEVFGQPLRTRKDYGNTRDKKKEALMFKSIPIEDYDDQKIKKLCEVDWEIEDYDEH